MQDVLLLAAVAVTFALGWFLMGKLDRFLEADRHEQESRLSSGGNALRLGFCDPMCADSVTEVLEQYSGFHPDLSVHVFFGSERELLKGLLAGKFDVIFLQEHAEGHLLQKALWTGETASAFVRCLTDRPENKSAASAQVK